MAEINVDLNMPSTSSGKLNLSQPFRDKTSANNVIKDRQNSVPATSPKQKSIPTQNQIVNNSISSDRSLNHVTTQFRTLNTSNEHSVQIGNVTSNKKNARRKEKKKLLLDSGTKAHNVVSTIDHNYEHLTHTTNEQNRGITNYVNCMHQLFVNQIGPLYAPVSSQNLETFHNQSHSQYLQGVQMNLLQHNLAQLTQQNIPNYIQNVMQHPLLCTSTLPPVAISVQNHISTSNRVTKKDSKSSKGIKRGVKNGIKNGESKKFEEYLSIEDVEMGLRSNKLIEGILRINPKLYQHAYVSTNDRDEQDVFIDGMCNRNRALEGDIVVVQLINSYEPSEDKQQKKGKVVYIKERIHHRTCIGTLKLMPDKNRQLAYFVPRDFRIPRLNIPCTSWPDGFYDNSKKFENVLFLAKILDWTDTRFAVGTIEYHIGLSGDLISEEKAILAQNNLDVTPFEPQLKNLYPSMDYKIPDDEIKLREDCRNLCIFSIDPFNCRDIDDAMSCKELENGNYEIGVHISDVAHFLTENTKLDKKVCNKATTIYLVQRAYHMLPDDLCLLCSLFPAVDKLAFSVFWEVTKDAEVLNHRFAKTVINSCCKLSYEHAQSILEDVNETEFDFPEIYNGFTFQDVYSSIKILGKIAAIFRKSRFDSGALRINQPKISFMLNSSGLPESFTFYVSKESHQLIEEFMLLANMTVAKRIHDDFPKIAFLRCHPPPSTYMLRQLATSLGPLGIELDYSSAGALHRSLLPYIESEDSDKGKAMVLSMLCAKPMTRAKYFCSGGQDDEEFRHYALNVPLYTHFTSPIRRYADVMVHR